jgi:hypothetical protein
MADSTEKTPRGNGITLVFGGQVFLTQPPIEDDGKLIGTMKYAVDKHNEEGRPLSGEW